MSEFVKGVKGGEEGVDAAVQSRIPDRLFRLRLSRLTTAAGSCRLADCCS